MKASKRVGALPAGGKASARSAAQRDWWDLTQRDWLLLALIAIASLAVQTFFLNYTVDDAFITFRYSHNLVDGLGLAFNPGEHVEGFTNFLWMLYCAIPSFLGISVLWFSKVTLMILSAANLFLMVRLFRRVAPNAPWWISLVPPGVLALHTSFTLYAVNGIETQLFCFLVLLALYMAAREFDGGGWLSAIFFGLLFYTRPDGFMFFAITWLARLLFGRKDRSFLIWTSVFLAMAAGLTAFRLVYFGYPVPNTFYVKSAGTIKTRVSLWGIRYFRDMFRVAPNWFYLLLPLAGLAAWRRLSKFARFMVFVPYVYLVYVLYIGGDVNFPHFRFLLHVLPIMAIAALFPLLPRDKKAKPGRALGFGRICGLVLSLACVVLQLRHSLVVWRSMNATPESRPYRYLSLFPLSGSISIYPEIARYLKENCDPGSVVVMQDVGAIPFYSGLKTFDIIGLVNGPLAHYFYKMNYSDYLIDKLPEERVQEIDKHVRDLVIDSVRADYVLYHTESGDPYDLGYSFHYHGLAYDSRFPDLYHPIAAFYYPATHRCDYVLFKRRTAASPEPPRAAD
ncbi:MAG TPA: hypothetical protein VMH22_02090 [bacterium]|nr:hypothetical protein [bacterium]